MSVERRVTSENNALELGRCISPRHSNPDTLFPLDTRPSTLVFLCCLL